MLIFHFAVKIQRGIFTTSILLLERVYGITPVMSSTEKWSWRKGRNCPWIEEVIAVIKNVHVHVKRRSQICEHSVVKDSFYENMERIICIDKCLWIMFSPFRYYRQTIKGLDWAQYHHPVYFSGPPARGGPTAGSAAGRLCLIKINNFTFIWMMTVYKWYCNHIL